MRVKILSATPVYSGPAIGYLYFPIDALFFEPVPTCFFKYFISNNAYVLFKVKATKLIPELYLQSSMPTLRVSNYLICFYYFYYCWFGGT